MSKTVETLGLEDLAGLAPTSEIDQLSGGASDENVKKRASAKFISYNLFQAMLKGCGEYNKRSFENALKCSNQLKFMNFEGEERTTAKFCKNRLCVICNRIRSAQYQNKYLEEINKWDAHFVTLTRKTVTLDELPKRIDSMYNYWAKRRKRVISKGVKAIRKLEITYNPVEDKYHPHYHIIIDGQLNAGNLRDDWLKHYPEYTNYWAQDVRKADKGSVQELFKYFTKMYTRPKAVDNINDFFVNWEAVENMYNAIKGKRIIQPIGFKIAKLDNEDKEEKDKVMKGYALYYPELKDWVDHTTGELLTGYEPSQKTVNYLKKF